MRRPSNLPEHDRRHLPPHQRHAGRDQSIDRAVPAAAASLSLWKDCPAIFRSWQVSLGGDVMSDRREAARLRKLKSGKIAFDKVRLTCTVKSLSESGACLEFQT